MKSTVEALQEQLDRVRYAHDLRMVLADALDEVESELASGYRAIGKTQRVGYDLHDGYGWYNNATDDMKRYTYKSSEELPEDWYYALPRGVNSWESDRYNKFCTRRDADDALALAFTRLPPERQAELLNGKL